MKRKPTEKPRRRSTRKAAVHEPERTLAAAHPIFAATPGIDDRLIAAYHQAIATYGQRPDVTGIDIGLRRKDGVETGALAVRIHVREKFARRHVTGRDLFPSRIDGQPVDVIESSFERHAGAGAGRFSTLQPGISIGHPRLQSGSGTLGLLVSDAAGQRFLLSASHVIVPDNFSQPGDPILQPGRSDGGAAPADTIATVARFDLRTDSALAALNGARPVIPEQLGSNALITGVRAPGINDILTKSGRSTDVTTGRVDGVGGPFGGVQASFHMVPDVRDGTLMCDFGDSGAVWYDAKTGQGVGLHSMGAPHPTSTNQFAVASALTVVLQKLKVTL